MRIFSKLMPASKMKLVISSIGVLALVVFSGFVLFEASKAEVIVIDNGEKQTVKTHADTVKGLLAEAGISVGKHDELSHEQDTPIEAGMEIDYKTANKVIISIDGEEKEYYTTRSTIEEFLAENNLEFTNHDAISHKSSEAIQDGLHINVKKAYQITIKDGKEDKKAWTTGGAVKDLLAEANIEYDDDDKIEPGLDKQVDKDTTIKVIDVEKVTDEITESIAFETEKKNDSSLSKGKEKVISQGENGAVVKKYEVIKENGKEVKRELIEKKVTKESKKHIVAIGTKAPQPKQEAKEKTNVVTLSSEKPKSSEKSKSEPSKKKSGGKVFTMSASAYTASCSGCSGYTTTGINLNANPNKKVIAVDPSIIPLGSRVWVEGYGEAIAGDTGGHIVGNRIDIHVPTKSAAYSWGRRTVQVKILD
ncbi:G5 and 3D domain-containing protein [Virgibacillus sp. SK37]|uniref:G5 and 3D domain-containing protein n=1 Tax=Virgibacillus sp. SK37 TaxID=403957 RepID=UPI0004D1D093|nr:G5 and 3D domain-containing protein [Virgibacillus sp. SK37]AIF41980.1 hypothetical protein X953_00295 [Virgibacillus sp. SK37]